jgi:hypothetical protein
MAKSAKSTANCRKIRTLCADNLRSFFWNMATSKKQLFCHLQEKAAREYVDEIDALMQILNEAGSDVLSLQDWL